MPGGRPPPLNQGNRKIDTALREKMNTMYQPATIDTAPDRITPAATESDAATASSPLARVLVIDDEHVVCDAIARQLRDVGYHVVVAYSGSGAIDAIRSESFDIALIDIRMPKVNGFGVLRELREKSNHTKAIMMTAYADIRSAVDSITLGAIDIISKPVDVDEVIMTIARCLNN